jgi:hypothetical protein
VQAALSHTSDLSLVRQLDLVVLAIALPAFLLAGFPMLGYAVAAGAWLVQWLIHAAADRRAKTALASGNRTGALGVLGAATLGRVWLVTLAVLLVGLLGEREDGLAAAVLSAVLVTAYFASLFWAHVVGSEDGGE